MRNNISNGTVTKYHENGSIKGIYKMVDEEVETYKIFYESGVLKMESINIDSLKSKTTTYYNNGNIKTITNYERYNTNIPRKDSKMIGEYLLFFENGDKYLEGFKQEDELKQINCWDKDGRQTLINGNGFYSMYYDYGNGSVEGKGPIKDGRLDGVWKYYNEDGTLKEEKIFKDGKLIETKED
tara:strand:- start:178 stop:726 length:549 start_codon:yes stop_codon:yes gene_type:complete